MSTPIPVQASIPVELTLNLTGLVEHLSAAMSDTNQPEVFLSDIAIEHLLYETYEARRDAIGNYEGRHFITHDLLEGVDTTSPDVQLLLSNLLTLVEASASEALLEGARD